MKNLRILTAVLLVAITSNCPALPREIKIIQGDRDMTVDWRYNTEFIRGKFAQTDVTMVRGGDHELLNESEAIRSKVYEYISKYLQE